MPLFSVIAHAIAPSRQVEDRDRRLEHAQALFEKHRAVMNPHHRDLAHSLLDYSSDLRNGFEAKSLPSRIKQARLYCTQVDKTLQKIQAVVEKIDG
jgi:hypothetical protein